MPYREKGRGNYRNRRSYRRRRYRGTQKFISGEYWTYEVKGHYSRECLENKCYLCYKSEHTAFNYLGKSINLAMVVNEPIINIVKN